MHETIQATSAPCPWGNGTVGKAFGENAFDHNQWLCSESGGHWPPALLNPQPRANLQCSGDSSYGPRNSWSRISGNSLPLTCCGQ